ELGQQFVRDGPRRSGGVAADGMQPDAETHTATALLGQFAYLRDLGRRRLRGLAPRQIDVDVLRGDRQRGRRRATEVDLRQRIRWLRNTRISDREVFALEVDGVLAPHRVDDVKELPRACVALVVVKPVAEPTLLEVVAAADNVEQ